MLHPQAFIFRVEEYTSRGEMIFPDQQLRSTFTNIFDQMSISLHHTVDLLSSTSFDFDDRKNAFDLHRSVNRVIAGDLIGTGDVAVANNILDMTCRIQYWNLINDQPPAGLIDMSNVILSCCKLNNDNSVDISEDGRLLAAFVENETAAANDSNLWAHTLLKVVSLLPDSRGVVLYQKIF
uniref:Uncharacterized protein n=1 Tax=Romanomermis culicivorax TaxID=13658 RepID=A0A915KIA1_ROMCU